MTDHFPISKSEAASEIRQLIVASGLDNLTSKIIRMHLETKFKVFCAN
jgi:hypothetical protein